MTSRVSSALVIGVVGAISAIVWSGCGPGDEARYYCDSASCYDCDAYGCAPVKAPAHPTCSGATGCKAGTVCTSTGCTAACTSNATCPKGETCQKGYCSTPGVDPGGTKECTTKADCGDGKTCTAGACKSCGGTAGPCPCTATPDCSGGFTCVKGSCTAPSNVCKYSSECADGKLCAEGQCLPPCNNGACSGNATCEKGVCQPPPGGGGGGGGGGGTPQTCTEDTTCGAGNYCNQGVCGVDTRPKPNCTKDEDCASGATATTPKKCLGGYCKYTCGDKPENYCRTIDNRIGVCAKKDGVCRSSSEAEATCYGPGECSNGQSCVDNKCL